MNEELQSEREQYVAISGYFNPLHTGHLDMIKEASKLGSLLVIVNNDKQVKLKGSVPFMNEQDRLEIIKNIKGVDTAVLAIDEDSSVCKTLEKYHPDIFANGGDRKEDNIPEYELCDKLGIKMMFNIGGGKSRNSSDYLKDLKPKKVILGCGNYKREGWIGLDKGDYGQEIVRDMRKGLPFSDNSCDELFIDQVLEHIQFNEDYIFIMNECLRILQPGGKLEIRVPYYQSEVAYKDPTHCRYFAPQTFTYLLPNNEWEYGFDKRWKIELNQIEGGSQVHTILIADK